MNLYDNFLLVTDVDGTLANSQHKVSEKNKKALRDFVAQGGRFALATGRTPKNVVSYMEGLPVNAPCILYNGAALYSWQEQRFIAIRHLDNALVIEYLRRLMALFPKMCIEIFTAEKLYIVTDPANRDEHVEREKQEFCYAQLNDITEKTWIKILLCDSRENLMKSRELLRDFNLESQTNNFFSAVCYLEIVAKHVSKGDMLTELKNINSFHGKKVIAAGDFQNDIEMLKRADMGIAPANAEPDVKAAADMIAASNDEDLAHDIIYRILPTLV